MSSFVYVSLFLSSGLSKSGVINHCSEAEVV